MIDVDYSRRRKLYNVSNTQVDNFKTCKRKHFFSSVLRLPRPFNAATEVGNIIHDGAEKRALDGDLRRIVDAVPHPDLQNPDAEKAAKAKAESKVVELKRIVEVLEPFMPLPGEEFYAEHKFDLQTHVGIPWLGKIDLWRDTKPLMTLTDWKSTSDLRYVKTPAELYQDIQLGSYAEYAFRAAKEAGESVDVVKVGLVYVSTKLPKIKPPKVVPVFLNFERRHVTGLWDSVKPVLDEMMVVAQAAHHDDVEPTTTACVKYGGCPYREQCGLAPTTSSEKHSGLLKALTSKKTENTDKENTKMGFLDRLNKANGAGAPAPVATKPPPTKAAAPKPAATKPATQVVTTPKVGVTRTVVTKPVNGAGAKVPTGIVPDDAPPRDSGVEPDVEAEAAAEGSEEAQEGAEAAQEAPKKKGRPVGSKNATPATNGRRAFTLYMGCIVTKGAGAVEPTDLADWWAPIDMELNEAAQAAAPDQEGASWWQWSFADQKAAIAIKVQERIKKGLPPAMLVRDSSGSFLAKDILPMLLPHATQIIQRI